MSKEDRVYTGFLESQYSAAQDLNRSSEIVEIIPKTSEFCQLYTVRFFCRGLINEGGMIKEHDRFELAIYFPEQYLRRCDPIQTVRWIAPINVWHPNIRHPFICLGRITPGMHIVDIIYQAYEIVTFQKVTMNEFDSLNAEGCRWARSNASLFPIDQRPLRHRKIGFTWKETRKEVKK